MFTHVTLGANDVEASQKFYDAVLGPWAISRAASAISPGPASGI